MPCRDYEDHSNFRHFDQIKEHKQKIIRLSALLCSACRVLESKRYDFRENPELDRWWDNHKKADEKQREKETKAKLAKDEAMEIAKKPFKDLTQTDKDKLKKAGLM